jgi:hypothetical protein
VSRAIHSAGDIIFTLFFLKQDIEIGRMLDYGGGEGLLTRILRDHGFDAYNYDPYSISNLSFGFNLESILDNDRFSVISIIEVLEHLTNPREALGDLLKKTSTVFLSITTIPSDDVNPNTVPVWDYYALAEGQHINFPSQSGLQEFFNSFGLIYYCHVGNLILYSRTSIPKNVLRLSRNRYVYFAIKQILIRKAAQRSRHGQDADRIRQLLRKKFGLL